MGSAILFLVYAILQLLMLVVIVSAILSWLIAFDVLNMRNPTVYRIYTGLERVTDPLLAPIRRILPSLGGLDLSPIVFLLLLQALRILIDRTLAAPLINALG